jgi:hypothetical protein
MEHDSTRRYSEEKICYVSGLWTNDISAYCVANSGKRCRIPGQALKKKKKSV